MQIFLIVSAVVILIIVAFIFTSIKVYVEFDNVSAKNVLKLKGYIFSFLPVFIMKKEIGGKDEKVPFRKKFEEIVEYFTKSKADPVDYAKRKVKKSNNVPDIIKKFDFDRLYLESLMLSLCLDLNNAAASAISSGAVNAIISMVLEKYRDNIKGPVKYKVFPGYTGNGIKVVTSAKFRIRVIHILKVVFIKGGK